MGSIYLLRGEKEKSIQYQKQYLEWAKASTDKDQNKNDPAPNFHIIPQKNWFFYDCLVSSKLSNFTLFQLVISSSLSSTISYFLFYVFQT